MSARACFAALCWALALGGLLVGAGFILPALEHESTLVDPNLARALAAPLELRLSELVLLACLGFATSASRWGGGAIVNALSMGALLLAAADRVVLLPQAQQAWSRCDRAAWRPINRIEEAQLLEFFHDGASALLLVVLVSAGCLAIRAAAQPTIRWMQAPPSSQA